MTRWEMRLGSKQVVLLWGIVIVMMFVVFLVGLHAGRSQGISTALEEYGEQAVRLPVTQPVPLGGATAKNGAVTGTVDSVLAMNTQDTKNAKASETQPTPVFDFSTSKNLPTTEGTPEPAIEATSEPTAGELAAGFGARAADDLLKAEPVQKREEKTQPVAKVTAPEAVREEPKAAAKAASVAIPEPAAQESSQESLSSGWYIQLAATRSEGEATDLTRGIAHLKLAYVVERAKVGTRTFYRVLAGPYPTKEAATAARDRVKGSSAVKGEPFLKFVK